MEKNLIKASWNADGKRIAAGAGDGTAVIWNTESGKMLYKLPGHKGTVNCAELSPAADPISKYRKSYNLFSLLTAYLVLTGSSDRNLLLGELK
jgi:Prp8 binding protein